MRIVTLAQPTAIADEFSDPLPGRQPIGWIATALLGIVGSYVGGTLGSVVFPPHQFDVHPPIKHSFLGALVGAGLLLVIYKLVTSRTRTL
ncbi:MAG: GlsB/YeaQ/YmgE family stress response membrane protein [Mycobacterium sp.]